MGTKQHSNYESLITFTRASAGHALRPVSYGDELVTNGDFATDSDWTKGAGWTISGGKLVGTSVAAFTVAADSISLEVGKIYQIVFDVSAVTAGSVRCGFLGGTTLLATDNLTSAQTVTVNVVPNSGNNQIFIGSAGAGFTGSVESISVKEVTFDQTDGTLTLFEHPDNIPRVEYDADGNRLGLLVEESRTNLVTYSTPDSNWTDARVTISTNQATSPDGIGNATELVETTDAGTHYAGVALTVTASVDQALSAYVKQGTGSRSAILRTNNEGTDTYVIFDFTSESITETGVSVNSSSVTPVGNGWYRISFSYTQSADTGSGLIVGLSNSTTPSASLPSYTGDGSSSIYVYGAQFEEGSFPTSYIKSNSGSTTTRSTDVTTIPVADFGYNVDAGTLVWEGKFLADVAETDYLFNINDQASNTTLTTNSIRAFRFTDGNILYRVTSGGTSSVLGSIAAAPSNDFKYAYALDDKSFIASLDGTNGSEDTSTVVPTNLTHLHAGPLFFGHIKSIKYYPRRLTNAQLQALTEPRSTPTLSLTFDGQESSYKENYIHG